MLPATAPAPDVVPVTAPRPRTQAAALLQDIERYGRTTVPETAARYGYDAEALGVLAYRLTRRTILVRDSERIGKRWVYRRGPGTLPPPRVRRMGPEGVPRLTEAEALARVTRRDAPPEPDRAALVPPDPPSPLDTRIVPGAIVPVPARALEDVGYGLYCLAMRQNQPRGIIR